MTKWRNRRKWLIIRSVGLGGVMMLLPRAVAQEEKTDASAKPQVTNKVRVPIKVWRRTRQFERLERAILTEVKLDDGQRAKVKQAFHDLYRAMEADPSKANYRPNPYRAYSPEQMKKRQDDLKAAQKTGDKKLIRQIEMDIRRHTVGDPENLGRVAEDIVIDLGPIMRGAQVAEYKRVVDRWTALEVKGPDDGPIRMLMRATADPVLKLSADQEARIHKVLAETMKTAPRNRDFAIMAELGVQAKEKIMTVLTPEQRKEVAAHLQAFAREAKLLHEYAEKWYGQRGRAVPPFYKRPIPWAKK